jgi:hypothetical protein
VVTLVTLSRSFNESITTARGGGLKLSP